MEREGSFKTIATNTTVSYKIESNDIVNEQITLTFDNAVKAHELQHVQESAKTIFDLFMENKLRDETVNVGDIFVMRLGFDDDEEEDTDLFQVVMSDNEKYTLRHIQIRKSFEKLFKESRDLLGEEYVPMYHEDKVVSKTELFQVFKRIQEDSLTKVTIDIPKVSEFV